MDTPSVAIILGAVLGSGGIATAVSGYMQAKRSAATQWTLWNDVWVQNLDVMKKEINELRFRIAHLEEALRDEQFETARLRRLLDTVNGQGS